VYWWWAGNGSRVGEALKFYESLVSILPSTVRALLESQAYPHRPQKIELVQTQMSFIFLTGEYVYKIKKPVNLGYLDYTTLEKRRFFCHQELELNRRLCPNAYLAVVPIVEKKDELRIEGRGRAIEYAVKMRQLPQDRMMDVLLLRGQVTQEMVARVAEKLVNFHQKAETNPKIAAFGRLDVIRHNCDENFAQTEKYIGLTIPKAKYERIKGYTDNFIKSNASLFDKRVKEGKIRDCHGDLHAAHVCFTDDICIYDCIEFNDRFRYSDVASEIAFLAMDLDRYQQAGLSRHLVNTYVGLSHDEELLKLLNFYKCYRAYVRGKVESFKLDDPYIPEEEKVRVLTAAQSYFLLAESYV
jgi:aminoglycoside phosphotransferase family enzyme